ncbi:hypothetical protein SLS64_000965 [Diaporthe eres]|uniref:Secreted protein n=1 Tax=Diaporthe eres TaxID=83184 RepID=A0ABR1NZW2_DIAER
MQATCGSFFGGGGVVWALATVCTCAGVSGELPTAAAAGSSPLSSSVVDDDDEEVDESESDCESDDELDGVVGAKTSSLSSSSSSASPGRPVLLGPEDTGIVVGVCVVVVVAVDVCVMVRTRCWPSWAVRVTCLRLG